jgi:cytochrome c553
MLRKALLSSFILSAISVSSFVSASEAPAKYTTCASCHGANGVAAIPGYPNLAGQNKQYIINSYKAYQKGERNGGNAEVMKSMSGILTTDDEIEEVAEWLSKQK